MRRHSFDAISFVFAILFLAVAGGLGWETVDLSVDRLRWVGAVLLLALGAALLLSSRSRVDREHGGRHDADGASGS